MYQSSFEFYGSHEFYFNDKERESFEATLNRIYNSNENESIGENKELLSDEEGLNDKGKSDIHLSFRQVSIFDNTAFIFIFFGLISQNSPEGFYFSL